MMNAFFGTFDAAFIGIQRDMFENDGYPRFWSQCKFYGDSSSINYKKIRHKGSQIS